MYHGTHLLRHQAERSSSDSSRVLKRRLCQKLRARELSVVMAIETEMMMVRAAQRAMATPTRVEWRRRCWLEIVSTSAKVEENETVTHQCHLGHPSNLQIVRTDTSGVNVDAEE